MTVSSATETSAVSRHVAVCPFPFSSHPATLLFLSRKIVVSSPGVHISFFTTESSATALKASLPPEGLPTGIKFYHIEDGLAGESGWIHPLEAMRRFMEVSGETLRRSLAVAEEEIGVKISCVVADAFLSFVCKEIADEKAVQWVALWTSAASDLASHMYTDELRSRIATGEAHYEDSVDRHIPGFPPVTIADLAPEVVVADLATSSIARMLQIMSHTLTSASSVVMNSFHTLEPDITVSLNSAFNNIFLSAGPYSLTLSPPDHGGAVHDPSGCLPWLDTHVSAPASVVYISFGTAHTPPPEEFTALAEALEVVGVPFLWSLPNRFLACLPEGFIERTGKSGKGKVVTWAPQTSVLGHVAIGAQLTHCGWNSVTESIVSGVPMICRALAVAEQKFNERLVVSVWGIGVEVEGGKLTKAAAARAVERVLLEEEGKKIRETIRGMKKLAEEAAAEPNGSSARNLNKFISIITT
uniref:UGT3 n=1 Tax=Fagopyrum tataricum TaxID=62330 RepID=A0A1D8D201_FAGTA|nr:UGT3 [Fagopyrum tataricum]QAV53755.1 UGT714C1 [Fagopyrum tataricum]